MTIAGLLVGGLGVALLGSIKIELARKINIDEAKVGGLVSLFGFVMIPVMLSVGFVTDLIGGQAVLVGGSILMAGSLVVLALSAGYRSALLGVLMLSAAWSALINVINVLTPPAFLDPSELTDRIAYATNLANVFFGIGAFLTPLGVAFVLRRAGLTFALLILSALVLVPAILSVGVDFAALKSESASAEQSANTVSSDMGTLLANPMLWLCAMAMFFYGPLEASMGAWTTTYLGGKGIEEPSSSTLLSAFWLSFMVSRLVTALSLPPGNESVLIFFLSLACIVILSGVVWSRGRSAAIGIVIGAGFIFGPIFPTIMAILLTSFDASLHGRAVGLFFAIGGIGWTMIPIGIGAYARKTTLQRGFLIAVGSAVGLTVIAAVMMGLRDNL